MSIYAIQENHIQLYSSAKIAHQIVSYSAPTLRCRENVLLERDYHAYP